MRRLSTWRYRFRVGSIVLTACVLAAAGGGAAMRAGTPAFATVVGSSGPPNPVIGDGGSAHAAVPPGAGQAPGQAMAAISPPPGYPVRGIDVSSHDHDPDRPPLVWSDQANAGIKFAYAKATEGTSYVDPYYGSNVSGARGVGMYVGAYAFGRPDLGNPVDQADNFVNHMQWSRDGRTLPPFLDIEWPYKDKNGNYVAPYPCYGLSATQMVSWIGSFMSRLQARIGITPMIYTNVNWWNPCTGGSASFGNYLLDVSSCTSSPPSVPGWGSRWTFWQYVIPDCDSSSPHDYDVYHDDLASLAALAGGPRLSAVAQADGTVDVFWKGTDNNLWHKYYAGGTWNGPQNLGGGPLGSNPVAVTSTVGVVDVFWKGTDNNLWHEYYAGGAWNGPQNLGGGPLGSTPVAVGQYDGTVDVFWRGTDNNLWHEYYAGGGWNGPQSLGAGPLGSDPVAVTSVPGVVDVFWKGTDNNLWHEYYAGGTWNGPQNLGAGPLGSDPVAVTSSQGVVDVFWKGTDNNLWHKFYANGAWNGPQNLGGGPLGSAPVAAGQPVGTVDVFWVGTDSNLWHEYYANGAWNGPQNLGGGPIN
jgi:GH25 family lysozyme M1 (1,4-beta-N-acetylmuramidase)